MHRVGEPLGHSIGGRERAKHIDISKHYAHEVIQKQEMQLVEIDTTRQLADIFTKPLPYQQFLECLRAILRTRARVSPTLLPPPPPPSLQQALCEVLRTRAPHAIVLHGSGNSSSTHRHLSHAP